MPLFLSSAFPAVDQYLGRSDTPLHLERGRGGEEWEERERGEEAGKVREEVGSEKHYKVSDASLPLSLAALTT